MFCYISNFQAIILAPAGTKSHGADCYFTKSKLTKKDINKRYTYQK